jgi:hypothetical protein
MAAGATRSALCRTANAPEGNKKFGVPHRDRQFQVGTLLAEVAGRQFATTRRSGHSKTRALDRGPDPGANALHGRAGQSGHVSD